MIGLYGLLSILNIKKACAASLHSDRFSSDSTNDKQLSLAPRVSHSGPDPESPQSFSGALSSRYLRGILNQVQDDKFAVIPDPIRNLLARSKMLLPSRINMGILNQIQDDGKPSTSNTRRVLSPDNTPNAPFTTSHHTHSDGRRSDTFDHGIVWIGRTQPTIKAFRSKAYRRSSFSGALASAPYMLFPSEYLR